MNLDSFPQLKLRPREYQIEALKWALSRQRAVIVLPTGTGKTLIAVMWMKKLIDNNLVKRVVMLEPTRFLVEQVASYIAKVSDLKPEPIHGAKPREERIKAWREAKIIVATPEIVVADKDIVLDTHFDAVVVDECHHTTGKDAYVEAMQILSNAKYRLGLTAFIPSSRVREIEELIGEVKAWSWEDPLIKPYIPPWIAEVYEAELNEREKDLLLQLEELKERYSGRFKGLIQNAIRWFVRDGALALADSMSRATILSKLLQPLSKYLEFDGIRPAHKMDSLLRALRDHEGFEKAIVFIDRVIVAKYVSQRLAEMGYEVAFIRGRMRRDELREALERARARADVVVSTSAGEEGIDLPEADLLILWSILASPLKFIQRHGRVLRASHKLGKQRCVVYIVTIDTIDVDSLVDSLELARKVGIDVPIDPEIIDKLWKRTTRATLLKYLEGCPMTIDWLVELSGWPKKDVEDALRRLARAGHVVYIHTSLGKVYALTEDVDVLYEKFREYLEPNTKLIGKIRYRIEGSRDYSRAVTGTYEEVKRKLASVIERKGPIEELKFSSIIELAKGLIKVVNLSYTFLINDQIKLDLALKNAYSCEKIFAHTISFNQL